MDLFKCLRNYVGENGEGEVTSIIENKTLVDFTYCNKEFTSVELTKETFERNPCFRT